MDRRDFLKLFSGGAAAASMPLLLTYDPSTSAAATVSPVEPVVAAPACSIAAGKTFEQMSDIEKRIAIFKDVLERVDNQKLQPHAGAYVVGANPYSPYSRFDDERPTGKTYADYQDEVYACPTCLLGGLFVSFATMSHRLIGDCPVGLGILGFCGGETHGRSVPYRLQDSGLFSREQLMLMETAFEGRLYCFETLGSFASVSVSRLPQQVKDSLWLARRYYELDSDERIRRVCLNAIRNGGFFIPDETDLEPVT